MSDSTAERSPAELTHFVSLVPSVQYPHISLSKAREKVITGDFKTIGMRHADAELEIFLCTPKGLPVAIVDFQDGEVRR